MESHWTDIVRLSGLAQLGLAGGSLAIPKVLGWRAETAKLRNLTRQVFWTYAGYIWCAHVCFGALSLFRPDLLLDGSPLAAVVAGFIAAWWGARLAIQFTWFDRAERPPGRLFIFAEYLMVAFFVAMTAVYAALAWKSCGS
ncbi:MAG: hypothetical protein HYZ53_12510 [Planctomycetes bacterium]|nr:hypothetical protein [Planctomycetota bacterium]